MDPQADTTNTEADTTTTEAVTTTEAEETTQNTSTPEAMPTENQANEEANLPADTTNMAETTDAGNNTAENSVNDYENDRLTINSMNDVGEQLSLSLQKGLENYFSQAYTNIDGSTQISLESLHNAHYDAKGDFDVIYTTTTTKQDKVDIPFNANVKIEQAHITDPSVMVDDNQQPNEHDERSIFSMSQKQGQEAFETIEKHVHQLAGERLQSNYPNNEHTATTITHCELKSLTLSGVVEATFKVVNTTETKETLPYNYVLEVPAQDSADNVELTGADDGQAAVA